MFVFMLYRLALCFGYILRAGLPPASYCSFLLFCGRFPEGLQSWLGGLASLVVVVWFLGFVSLFSFPFACHATGLDAVQRLEPKKMQIPMPDRLLSDAQLRGRAQRLMQSEAEYKPARPLKAAEVVLMEKSMTGS